MADENVVMSAGRLTDEEISNGIRMQTLCTDDPEHHMVSYSDMHRQAMDANWRSFIEWLRNRVPGSVESTGPQEE